MEQFEGQEVYEGTINEDGSVEFEAEGKAFKIPQIFWPILGISVVVLGPVAYVILKKVEKHRNPLMYHRKKLEKIQKKEEKLKAKREAEMKIVEELMAQIKAEAEAEKCEGEVVEEK